MKLWRLRYDASGRYQPQAVKVMDLGHKSGVMSLAFNHGEREGEQPTRVATLSKDGILRVWRIDVRCGISQRVRPPVQVGPAAPDAP